MGFTSQGRVDERKTDESRELCRHLTGRPDVFLTQIRGKIAGRDKGIGGRVTKLCVMVFGAGRTLTEDPVAGSNNHVVASSQRKPMPLDGNENRKLERINIKSSSRRASQSPMACTDQTVRKLSG